MREIVQALLVISLLCSGAMAQKIASNNVRRSDGQPAIDKRLPEISQEDPADFVIGPEDVLSIMVWHEPDLTTKATVRPDGKIGLPLLNDVQASGRTPKQLQEEITVGLKKFMADPAVSVVVQEIHSQMVFITGAVAKPGAYPLGRPMTIMELLIRAGGLAEFAKSEDVQVLRKEANKLHRLRFNYKQFAEGKNYQQDIPLKSGAMVIVR